MLAFHPSNPTERRKLQSSAAFGITVFLSFAFGACDIRAQPTRAPSDQSIERPQPISVQLMALAARHNLELKVFPGLEHITLNPQHRLEHLSDLNELLPDDIAYRTTSEWLLIAPEKFLQDEHQAWVSESPRPICGMIGFTGEKYDQLIIDQAEFVREIDQTAHRLVIEPYWFGTDYVYVNRAVYRAETSSLDPLSKSGWTYELGRTSRMRKNKIVVTTIFYSDDHPPRRPSTAAAARCSTALQ